MGYHKPVLLNEVIEHLQINKDCKYIDATLGDAGHTLAILERGGHVLGIEVNATALERAANRIKTAGLDHNFIGVLGNFKDIEKLARDHGFDKVSGILFDLGYSSFELDDGGFGLSFLRDEPLDMRLDKTLGVTAADLVNSLNENALTYIIRTYSDEKLASKFAKAIVKYRSLKKIQTTAELAKVLADEASPGYEHGRIHPATRTFQALRIAVNDELTNLEVSLPRAARLLLPGGKLIVISFHSLEDRTTKTFGRDGQPALMLITKKPISPLEGEIQDNVRSRSAKMRVFERI